MYPSCFLLTIPVVAQPCPAPSCITIRPQQRLGETKDFRELGALSVSDGAALRSCTDRQGQTFKGADLTCIFVTGVAKLLITTSLRYSLFWLHHLNCPPGFLVSCLFSHASDVLHPTALNSHVSTFPFPKDCARGSVWWSSSTIAPINCHAHHAKSYFTPANLEPCVKLGWNLSAVVVPPKCDAASKREERLMFTHASPASDFGLFFKERKSTVFPQLRHTVCFIAELFFKGVLPFPILQPLIAHPELWLPLQAAALPRHLNCELEFPMFEISIWAKTIHQSLWVVDLWELWAWDEDELKFCGQKGYEAYPANIQNACCLLREHLTFI